jgi:hypothetical protein
MQLAVGRFRKTAKSYYQLRHVGMSVRPHGSVWLPMTDIHEILYMNVFRKNCLEHSSPINPLTPELNPSTQRSLPTFLLGIIIFKGLTARRLYKSFGVKGLIYDKNNGYFS